MKRRGYIISAILLMLDFMLFSFGGGMVALAAIAYTTGIGEHSAKVRCRAIQCDPVLGYKHTKLNNCYQRVREKIIEGGCKLPNNIKVYLIPGDEMNAYCFGGKSIGVTEGALNLDERTVEAMIAHEIGHLVNGDSVLNMVIVTNCFGAITALTLCHFVLAVTIYIVLLSCCLIGVCHFSFTSLFFTSKISGLIKIIIEVAKKLVLQVSHLLISALGRKSEFMADAFAAEFGYKFYLIRFLERFASDVGTERVGLFEILYDTHPSTAMRIKHLKAIN